MADEDKEKAEKLAAAKKRFEQLKKEQAKKGKKGSKKKADKADEAKAEEAVDDANEEAASANAKADENDNDGEVETEAAHDVSEPSQSKQRSESFRQATSQTARVEELEKENKALKEQHEQESTRLTKAEDELDSLREGNSKLAELRSKAKEADSLKTELAAVQRQLSQAQQAAKGPARRQSGATPDISEQLASKTSTIESLELDMSNLRNKITTLETTISERDASIKDLGDRVEASDAATDSAKKELDALKVSIAFPSDETKAANEDPEALTKRITVLESDLRSANSNLEAAAQRASSLEQKIEALTKLHKETTAASQGKDKELNDLRSQLKHRSRPSHVHDTSDFDLAEEETETGALAARVRALEAENFDLRRGVWRDQRAALQPGMEDRDPGSVNYEDVDLNGPYSPGGGHRGGLPRQTSTFQDVITSGISAFTGRARETVAPRDRAESMGLMSDDDGFDEEAFRLAQEEEAKRRIERIKEVKRGLDQWKGWRVDTADMRRNGLGPGRDVGPVFEV
ncbi:hypothetical protein CLAFUW4_01752 [Fulvia fulva]|uniref:M protein repeat protein n=1 Tax=Passalora fulva TaxID=5499 RepID=A0A9Q8L5A1_PASFU|nr:uncharacterized protein CLAFUR5_01748 [Fulvia fulva]KAK4634133.1 hypothetical protein CLAFUR4_01750 [Fulvia fulva]UJO11066.1 hypothetical protein CLAFUR5_01748 [Fulvia fulva]WPV09676.1 hypothetical protein CLAFUW4_01752 [Fulvia fulva]WPV23211.1 hypothetical protein CLAFUW7_01754 [Fulvia fulva]